MRWFKGIGWVGIQHAMADPDKHIQFVMKSSPFGSISHSHGDQNAFCMAAYRRGSGDPVGLLRRVQLDHAPEVAPPDPVEERHPDQRQGPVCRQGQGPGDGRDRQDPRRRRARGSHLHQGRRHPGLPKPVARGDAGRTRSLLRAGQLLRDRRQGRCDRAGHHRLAAARQRALRSWQAPRSAIPANGRAFTARWSGPRPASRH